MQPGGGGDRDDTDSPATLREPLASTAVDAGAATVAGPAPMPAATRPLGKRGNPNPNPSADASASAAAAPDASAPTMAVGSAVGASGGSSGAVTRPRRTSWSPGDLGDERYALAGQLGRGGMGEVLLARDEHIGRDVAIKRMRAHTPGPDELGRFLREARVQGQLEHPAVVPVYDLDEDRAGRPFIVMKRLVGITLEQLLTEASRAGADRAAIRARALRAFVDVCLAVELAHQRGVVHRDLKPSNVMLGDYGEVYVLDWGVARVAALDGDAAGPGGAAPVALTIADDAQTQAGAVIGTPGYMAPEQVLGEVAGPAADVYALGCILYEILAGQTLHGRGAAALVSTAEGVDARPSRLDPSVSPELDALCVHATALTPGQRTPSARALGEQLQRFLDGDRDLALRRGLVAGFLAEAEQALASGGADTPATRAQAMQAAGRALALEPGNAAAAAIVSRLMLTPPTDMPDAVASRLAQLDVDTARALGRRSALAQLGYLGVLPLLLWAGVRSWTPVLVTVGLVVASVGVLAWMVRQRAIPVGMIYVHAAINAVMIAVMTRVVSPLVIAPTLAATTLLGYAVHPGFGRMRWLGPILAAGVLGPWALEIAGVLASTYHFADGALVLHPGALALTSAPSQLLLAVVLMALLGVVGLLGRAIAKDQRAAQRQLELQAWHLRQLVGPGGDEAAASSSWPPARPAP